MVFGQSGLRVGSKTMARQPKLKTAANGNGILSGKPAKKRTAPTNTSLLPPCKVCQEPAAGFHYGANTCEACKGFFRRTLVRDGDYECVNGDEKCTVVLAELKGKKRICSRCRHLKCLSVGMSLQAVKTGRYTHSKRTQDILEYKQIMGRTTAATGSDNSLSPSPFTPPTGAASNSETSNSPPSNNTATTTILPSTETHPFGPAFPPCQFNGDRSQSEAMTDVTFPSQEHEPQSQYTTLKPAQFPGVEDGSGSGRTALCNGQALEGRYVPPLMGPPPHWQLFLSASSFVDNMLNRIVDAEPGRGDTMSVSSGGGSSTSSSSSSSLSTSSSTLWETSPPMDVGGGGGGGVGGGGDMSEEECQALTEHILHSYAASNFAKYTLSAEEILERQRACYENFQARIEVFGPMENLSEEEYQAVYQSTGIDVDNRQSFISTVSKIVEESIHEYIRFAKGIPGFSQLCMKDKITLIRDNRAEVMTIAQTTGYNHELQVFTLPSGRTFSMYDMERIGGKERQKVRCQCLHAIQRLGLSMEEKIMFKCLVLFTVGKDDVQEPQRVSAIQWRVVQCLRWLLKRNSRPNPDIAFARIIAVFGRLREFAMIFYEWLKSKPFAHYAQFKQSELLAEWFSNS